ncbi:YezD family protein [Laceyella putida]|uniref:YezD family protein n=1 Tax=Laceyella putida TaxID=110101 RepID=A0ABW2RJC3_9BACL
MKSLSLTDAQLQQIIESLEGLQYGSVLITVHDSHIIQIDRTEKRRYPLESSTSTRNRVPFKNKK